jgi:hypothetical protein
MAGAYGTKCPLTGIVIPHDWFRATRSEQRAPALDPLLPHGCADYPPESSQSLNSCDGLVMRHSFDATQQPIALRSSVEVRRSLLQRTTKRRWPYATNSETDPQVSTGHLK